MSAFVFAGAILISSCVSPVVVPEIPLPPKSELYQKAPDCVSIIEEFKNSEDDKTYELGTNAILCLDEDSIYWENQYLLLRNQVEAVQNKARQ